MWGCSVAIDPFKLKPFRLGTALIEPIYKINLLSFVGEKFGVTQVQSNFDFVQLTFTARPLTYLIDFVF